MHTDSGTSRSHFLNFLITSKGFFAIFLVFVGLSVWWFSIFGRGLTEGSENDYFTLLYPLMALIGAVIGFVASKKWGGFSSVFGKVIGLFSIGLFFQFIGQALYAYFIYVEQIEVPYPSLGDVGYFGSILFYIAGLITLGKIVATKANFRSLQGKALSIILPVLLLLGSYLFFLNDYQFDGGMNVVSFLDFGYPLGQATYLSIAILMLLASIRVQGGILKSSIIFLLASLVFQYFSDFMFLYQANKGTWYVAGPNDYLYFCSYFLMTCSILYIDHLFIKLRDAK